MATTSSKGRSTGGSKARKSGGAASSVSLSETDKKYVQESIGDAARRGLAAVGTGASSLFEALGEFGLNSERVERLREALGDIEVRESVEKAQEYLAEQIDSVKTSRILDENVEEVSNRHGWRLYFLAQIGGKGPVKALIGVVSH